MQHKEEVLNAALGYAKKGLRVIPIRKNGKILPGKKYNTTYTDATTDPDTINNWFGPGGTFEGWNLGIGTGHTDGVVALDVDCKNGAKGYESFLKLVGDERQENCPVAHTPSDGMHCLYQFFEGASTKTDVAPGIDIRGGYADKSSGHIVVWPSTIDGRQYTWAENSSPLLSPPPPAPDWLVELLVRSPSARRSSGRGNENVDDEEEQVSLEQVERMLACVDPDDFSYDDWVRTGMSVHSQHPDEEGLAVWDKWSQQGDRYKAGECSARWHGFKSGGTVRMGTLFHFAKQSGWEPTEEDVGFSIINEAIEKLNSEFAIVKVGGTVRVLNVIDGDLLRPGDFHILEAINTVEFNGKQIPVSKVWINDKARRTYRGGMALYPPESTCPDNAYNTWQGFAVESLKGDCSPMLNHVLNVICNGDEELNTWVLDWLADAVQDPANPKGCALVMRGKEGCGKGVLAHMFGKFFGSHYVHLIDKAHLTSNFNAHLIDCLLCFADEITWGGNKSSDGKLKGLVTEPTLLGERKGIDAVPYTNRTHLIIASNSSWVIPAGTESRRWCVLDVNDSRRSDRDYFNRLHQWLGEENGREAFLYYLLNRKVHSELRIAPTTEALIEQRTESANSFTKFLTHIVSMAGKLEGNGDSMPSLALTGDDNCTVECSKQSFYTAYLAFCKQHNYRMGNVAQNNVKTSLKKLGLFGPAITEVKRHKGGRKWVFASLTDWRSALVKMGVAVTSTEWETIVMTGR